MASNQIPINIDPSDEILFVKITNSVAYLKIQNLDPATNIAFKIKTTAPKNYVVKPNQGIVEKNSGASIEIICATTSADISKDKFLVQAAFTELKSGESYQLGGLWDTLTKADIKSYRIRVGIKPDQDAKVTASDTLAPTLAETTAQNFQSMAVQGEKQPQEEKIVGGTPDIPKKDLPQYEKAPDDDINRPSIEAVQTQQKEQAVIIEQPKMTSPPVQVGLPVEEAPLAQSVVTHSQAPVIRKQIDKLKKQIEQETQQKQEIKAQIDKIVHGTRLNDGSATGSFEWQEVNDEAKQKGITFKEIHLGVVAVLCILIGWYCNARV